jgi:hypothetical protein
LIDWRRGSTLWRANTKLKAEGVHVGGQPCPSLHPHVTVLPLLARAHLAGGWTRSPRLHRPSFDTENAHTRGKRADQALIAACRIEGELGSSLNVRPTKTQHLSQSTVPRVARRHGSWPTTKVVLQLQRPPHQARARVIQQRHRLWWHRPNLPHDVGHGRGRSA